jgi:predicted metalloprotease
MPMQGVYELDGMDRARDRAGDRARDRAGDRAGDRGGWLVKSIASCIFVLVLMVVVCTVLALDASMTTEQRIATFQQSGVFP